MTSYSSCSIRHGRALAAAAAFVALSLAQPRSAQAITLRPSSEVLVPPAASVCYRSPDIVVQGGAFYVAYVAGPCSGPGAYVVRVGRYDGVTVASLITMDVRTINAPDVRAAPLVRISAALGQVVVAIADRSGPVSQLSTAAFDRNLGRLAMMGPQIASGVVGQLSFDCSSAALPPCVLSTMEADSGNVGPRVFSYFTVTNPGVAPMLGARMDLPIAIASVAGTVGQSATVFATNSMLDAAPQVMVSSAPMGATSPLAMGGQPVAPGIAALRFVDGQLGAYWSAPGTLRHVVRSQWSAIAGAREGTSSIVGDPYFVIEDAAVVGANALLVGRTSASTTNLESSPLGYAESALAAASPMIEVVNTRVVARSQTRVAAAVGQCEQAGKGAMIYALGPAGAANEIHVRRFTCSDSSECVDPGGAGGACVAGVCQFGATSRCAPSPSDAGVVDASIADAAVADASHDATMSDVSTIDGAVADASVVDVSDNVDASLDDAADSGARDASADGSPRDGGGPPAITGGACGCRAPGSTQGRAAATWLALVAALALASRRRR